MVAISAYYFINIYYLNNYFFLKSKDISRLRTTIWPCTRCSLRGINVQCLTVAHLGFQKGDQIFAGH